MLLAALFLCSCLGAAWEKVLLTDAVENGARCLDGSPGGFYYRAGQINSWIVFHQGGGWCTSDEDCYARSQTALGSSVNWGPTYNDTYEGNGLFNQKPFRDWHIVYAMYCDGSSWASEVESPIVYNNSKIYYRGRALLDALISKLLNMGLQTSNQTIFAGCSAGALTTYMHADYFASRMPKSMDVCGLADAWFAHDSQTFEGQPSPLSYGAKWLIDHFNMTRSIPASCASKYGPDQWQCLYGANLAPSVQLPLFIFNSKYDPVIQSAILNLTCNVTQCEGAEKAFWLSWGAEVVAQASALPSRHGVFLSNCVHHCDSGTDGWKDVVTSGVLLQDAFATWFDGHAKAQGLRWLPKCDGQPCPRDRC